MIETEHTEPLALPPPEAFDAPVSYRAAERTLFGLTPTAAVAVLALLALVAAAALALTGQLVASLLLLVGALLLAALFLEQALHRRESAIDRVAASAVDRSRGLVGFAGASARAWTAASRDVTRLRLELRRLKRTRAQLLAQLGAAAYAENDAELTALRARMRVLDERIDECDASVRAAIGRARHRTSRERLAVASTEVQKPG